MIYKTTIPGNPVTKKNSQKIITNSKTGRPMVIQSDRYRDYARMAKVFVKRLKTPINEKCNLCCVYYRKDERRVDLINLLEATQDILVEAGILADDNSKIVVSVDGSRVLCDRNNPRVEIEITEVTP